MNKIIFVIFIFFGLFALIVFYKIFSGIYISYLINQGLYRNKELEEFSLNLTNEEEYNLILEKINLFISQILEGLECSLSMNSDDINCLIYKGLTPIKPYALTSKIGLLLYSFELNRLFEEKISYAGSDGVCYEKYEILFDLKIPYNVINQPSAQPDILIKKKFIYPDLPSNKLEEWIREKEENTTPIVSFIYRSNFILSLFNTDLDFTQQNIIEALKKIKSLEIVDSQLIFTADTHNQISYD